MPNPFDFVHEIRDMNRLLVEKLDEIIQRLDILIAVTQEADWYGDGK